MKRRYRVATLYQDTPRALRINGSNRNMEVINNISASGTVKNRRITS